MKAYRNLKLFIALTFIGMCGVVASTQATVANPPVAPEATADVTEESVEPLTFSVAGGAINFTADGNWKSVPPKSRMLEREIKVPHVESDKRDGRLTIMRAGGSIEANVARWEGQFKQPDGSATKAQVTQAVVEEMDVTLVDISGTYIETMGGPFAGGRKIQNAGYRVLAAIIRTDSNGNYFVKLIGPQATITANEKAFDAMIKSVKVQD